jgi:hypothetical protein
MAWRSGGLWECQSVLLLQVLHEFPQRGACERGQSGNCIERSQPMVRFFHRFRQSMQFCGRSGPIAPLFSDFAGLDLKEIRAWDERQNETVV